MLLTSNGRQTCNVPSERNFLFLEMLLVLMGWAGWESLPHLMHLYFSPQIYEKAALLSTSFPDFVSQVPQFEGLKNLLLANNGGKKSFPVPSS